MQIPTNTAPRKSTFASGQARATSPTEDLRVPSAVAPAILDDALTVFDAFAQSRFLEDRFSLWNLRAGVEIKAIKSKALRKALAPREPKRRAAIVPAR